MVNIYGYYMVNDGYMVVQYAHIEKWWSERQWEGWQAIYEMEHKTCLKPPTRYY